MRALVSLVGSALLIGCSSGTSGTAPATDSVDSGRATLVDSSSAQEGAVAADDAGRGSDVGTILEGGDSALIDDSGPPFPNGGRQYKTIVNLVDPALVQAIEAVLVDTSGTNDYSSATQAFYALYPDEYDFLYFFFSTTRCRIQRPKRHSTWPIDPPSRARDSTRPRRAPSSVHADVSGAPRGFREWPPRIPRPSRMKPHTIGPTISTPPSASVTTASTTTGHTGGSRESMVSSAASIPPASAASIRRMRLLRHAISTPASETTAMS